MAAGVFPMSRAPKFSPVLCVSFLLCLTAGRNVAGSADEPQQVESSLTFLSHMETVYVNIDQDPLTNWVKPIFEVVDHRFLRETKPRTIVVEVTLHTDRPAVVVVASRPALSQIDSKAVLDSADTAKSPHSRVVDATFRIVTKIKGGTPDNSGPLTPAIPPLGDRKLARFKPAILPEKLALLRSWARGEAIPLLAEFALHRDRPEHAATRNFGKALKAVKREGPIDVALLTEKNPDFWRAMIEAPRGDLLIPAAYVAVGVAAGEIAYGQRLGNAIEVFGSEDFGALGLLRDFRARFQLIDAELSARLSKGIALHDQSRFEDALKIYDDVLKDDPKSAWALYERFQTEMAKGLKANPNVMPDWSIARKAIIAADPLYESMAEASNMDELYDLLLRRESKTLFKNKDQFTSDILRFADIALDLGQPVFAAMLYWQAWREIDPEAYQNRKLVEDVLYCLEQLGVKDVQKGFPGNHVAEFKRIDAERAKRKQQTPAALPPADETAKPKQ
jgi:tetratricopeptide (TPR) repeat protein